MNRFLVVALLGALLAVPSWAQPTILAKGIVNSASYMLPEVPGGSIAQGSLFSIFGTNLGSTAGETLTFPLPTEFAGISIAVTQGATTVAAYPLVANGSQINAIMPSNAPLGEVEVTVTVNGQESNAQAVTVVTRAVGIYAVNQAGSGPGVIQNVISADNRPVNSLRRTATRSMVLTLWATGLGAIDQSDGEPPPIADITRDLVITVGGVQATSILYAGRSQFAGVDQINFRVPTTAPEGCFVPVTVRTTDSGITSNAVTIAIQADGAVCSDPANPAISSEISGSGLRLGTINLSRTSLLFGGLPAGIVAQNLEFLTDSGSAEFQRITDSFFDPTFSAPAVGSCTSYVFRGSVGEGGEVPDINEAPRNGLDAGPQITVAREGGETKIMERVETGLYTGAFATVSTIPGFPTDDPFLEPGTYQVSGPGGAGGNNSVGPFSATLELGPSLDWLNRDDIETVVRSQGVTIRWSGGDPANQLLYISGSSADDEAEVFGVFFCISSLAPGEFTVPGSVLANFPASTLIEGQAAGLLSVGTTPNASGVTDFTATGLDKGLIYHNEFSGRLVAYE